MVDISVLYVEDEAGIRQSVARSLSLLVKNVQTAENGLEALEKLHKHPVDLIISDIKMPKMDGLTLIEQLRQEGYAIPIVITSAFNETEYLSKAIDLKVDKFINKPIRVADLVGTISKVAEAIYNRRKLQLQQQELEHYRQAIEQTNFVIRITPEGTLLGMNREVSDYFNEKLGEDLVINAIDDLLDQNDAAELLGKVGELKIFSKTASLRINDKNFTVWITAFPSLLEEDHIIEITLLLTNITEVVHEKEKIIERLYTDELTELPNRQKLFYDLTRRKTEMAMMIVDIDGFSNLNHLYSFDKGDEILKQMGTALTNCQLIGQPWTLYRSDMDHFVILIEKPEQFDLRNMEKVAKDIIGYVEAYPFVIGNVLSIEVGITIGASCIGETDLFSEASLALQFAKSSHKAFQCYSALDGQIEHFEANLRMQGTIKNALSNGMVINYYQPILDRDGNLVKYEALVRIRNPENPEQIMSPFQFLDIAQQSKNYPLLTKRVIDNAFRDFADSSYGFSINLSFDDISNPEIGLYLEKKIKAHQGAGEVTLELLESEGLKDIEQTINFCHQMKSFGAKIAIDDFGSGYSNFVYFFDMPIDILKIDGSLVKRIHDYRGYLALETIVKFANSLGVRTVAEFVEDEALFSKLKTLGVDMFQGYYFSPPKPFDEL